MNIKIKRQFSPFQIIIVGFLLAILLGSVLLMIPAATSDGHGAGFLDALFTSVSAVCVTGLSVKNTAQYWSEFGQAVILLLIQVGGLGVVTVGLAVAMFSGRKISLLQRSTMQAASSSLQLGGMVRFTSFMLKIVFVVEFVGVVCLFPSFAGEYGIGRGLWYALFHSVSAFCNAGFDLMGANGGNTSLMGYAGSPAVLLPISFLVIAGGIGFLTWDDIVTHGIRIRKYRMQSKIVLLMTAILLVGSFAFFYCLEFSSVQWKGLSGAEQILSAWFQAVSPRTAGFNTVDLTDLSDTGQLVTIMLMLTGGVSGSTAGGFKVNTLAVLLLTMAAVVQKREDAQCFGRRISKESVYSAVTIFFLYMILFIFGGIVISCVEQIPLLPALFETASAVGTVGLSLGLTGSLEIVSKVILILLMFLGRVGGLTMVFAMVAEKNLSHSQFPEEKITVG